MIVRAALLAAVLAAPAAAQVSKPFLSVELRMAPFRGEDSAETKRRAEAFLKSTGRAVIGYQDNEAVGYVDVDLPRAPEGLLAGVSARIARARAVSALRARPKVAEVVEFEGGRLGVRFSPAPYREEAARILSTVPSGTTVTYHLNPLMHGLWTRLDVTGVADPKAFAADLARRHPAEVERAEVLVEVEVMRIEAR